MYRVNSAILILSFVATHILSVGLVLLRYCQQRHISWRQIPSRCALVRPHLLPLAAAYSAWIFLWQLGSSLLLLTWLLSVSKLRLQRARQLVMSKHDSSACTLVLPD